MQPALARDLSFDERVEAQAAIERVYHSHVTEDHRPFDVAVPITVLTEKVRLYLRQSAALEHVWHLSVSPEMLRTEMDRVARDTRFPGRLLEIYHALGDDAFLVQECFARPTLVRRLSAGLFDEDEGIHAGALKEAKALHSRLVPGDLALDSPTASRTVAEVSRSRTVADEVLDENRDGILRLHLEAGDFARWRAKFPKRVLQVGEVTEERDAFVVRVVLREDAETTRVVTYAVPKRNRDDWWDEVRSELDRQPVRAVASEAVFLPTPVTTRSRFDGDIWDNGILDDVPEGRTNHVAVWTGTEMIVWGGGARYDGGSLQTGGRYDPLTDSWKPTTTVGAPLARHRATAVWTGSQMIVWGGIDTNTGGRYDPATDTWLPTSLTGAPAGRVEHAAVWDGTEMLVWGGSSDDLVLDDGGRYDPVTDSWSPMATLGSPTRRRLHTGIWDGEEMIVWGGCPVMDCPLTSGLASGGRYDPATDVWRPVSNQRAPARRSKHTAVWSGAEMIVWGGEASRGELLASGGRYDPKSDAWKPVSTTGGPMARRSHTAVWTGEEMLVWGGELNEDKAGGRYDPATNSWAPISSQGFATRRGHTAVWTGTVMVIWGGEGSIAELQSGGRYDPRADRWTPTYTAGAPMGSEYGHTVIWTGTEMIVWGGNGGADYMRTGGRYDPLTDAWASTTTRGAPGKRFRHTAVWTGTEMIVWAGYEPPWTQTWNTGGRYDPLLDSWRPVSLSGAPAQRIRHSAVWTGTQMIVWGGQGYPYVNDGAVYDPASDSWYPTSLANAPVKRFNHCAVWTGREMIVWGGYTWPSGSATGGRYDPATDSWTPTTTTDAPPTRVRFTAVWTGKEMIVWGGGDSIYNLQNTGSRYDPLADTWTPTILVDAPEARNDHSAIWDGARMIVWGGSSYPVLFGTGKRYDPISDSWASMSEVGAPSARDDHTAVWTGIEMIVWGGGFGGDTGGRYIP